MSRCPYCRFSGDKHDPDCPTQHPDEKAAVAVFNHGWTDGRAYKPKRSGYQANPIYLMGYGSGEVAAEEAANGYDPRFG